MTSVPFLNRIIADDVKETQYMVLLRGAIIPRQLEMLDPSNSLQSLKRVAFGNTYYGTSVSRKVLLYNNSPVSTQYLAVLNNNVDGSVDGMYVNEGLAMVCSKGGLGQKAWREQGNALPGENLVQVIPMQVCTCMHIGMSMVHNFLVIL